MKKFSNVSVYSDSDFQPAFCWSYTEKVVDWKVTLMPGYIETVDFKNFFDGQQNATD